MIEIIKNFMFAYFFIILKNRTINFFQIPEYLRLITGNTDSLDLHSKCCYEMSIVILLLDVFEVDRENEVVIHCTED